MKLLELYLDEVRSQLPPKNRQDILNEIRSTLMDMIEDRKADPSQEASEEVIKAVLQEFGSPRQVARDYGARNYLVGPRLYPVYLQVLRIVLIVVAAVNVLGLILAVINQTSPAVGVFETTLEVVGGLFSSLFTAFGIVTLAFAGIERTAPEEWKISVDEEWSPDDLQKHDQDERISITELAIEITLSLIFIAVLNFFLDRVGMYYLSETGWVSAPILNQNFNRYIPWLTAGAVLDIGLNLYLIRKGFWDKLSVIAKVLVNAFKIALTFAILVGPSIFTIEPTAWQTFIQDASITAQELTRILNLAFDVIFGLAIFGLVVDSIKRLYQTFIKGGPTRIEISSD